MLHNNTNNNNNTNNKYFQSIKYGNIYFNLISKITPLLLWGFFCYKYYLPYYKSCKNCSPIFLGILLVPIFIIVIELLLNKDIIFSLKPQIVGGWPHCINMLDFKNKDILATYNYNCAKVQEEDLTQLSSELQYKFYYLNTTLFLLILIFNNLSKLHKKTLENYNIIFIAITLFIGVLGILPPSFNDNYMWSLIAMMVFGTLLNMNIAAFLVVLYSLF